MRQWLILKIGYVYRIPQEGGGRAYLANSLIDVMTSTYENQVKRVWWLWYIGIFSQNLGVRTKI